MSEAESNVDNAPCVNTVMSIDAGAGTHLARIYQRMHGRAIRQRMIFEFSRRDVTGYRGLRRKVNYRQSHCKQSRRRKAKPSLPYQCTEPGIPSKSGIFDATPSQLDLRRDTAIDDTLAIQAAASSTTLVATATRPANWHISIHQGTGNYCAIKRSIQNITTR